MMTVTEKEVEIGLVQIRTLSTVRARQESGERSHKPLQVVLVIQHSERSWIIWSWDGQRWLDPGMDRRTDVFLSRRTSTSLYCGFCFENGRPHVSGIVMYIHRIGIDEHKGWVANRYANRKHARIYRLRQRIEACSKLSGSFRSWSFGIVLRWEDCETKEPQRMQTGLSKILNACLFFANPRTTSEAPDRAEAGR